MTEHYAGTELGVFANARNWKSYLRELIRPYLKGDVLEVGAGIGTTTCAFRDAAQASWTCLEPDASLAAVLRERTAPLPWPVDVRIGTIASLTFDRQFDCVLYIDVLEHIEADAAEVRRAMALLTPAGALIVLSPAHQRLYTPFDAAIGHYRRYNAAMLRDLSPPTAALVELRYVDAAGMIVSAANRLFLHSASPTTRQVLFWDRFLVPISRRLDPVLGGRIGKSILGVWRRASIG